MYTAITSDAGRFLSRHQRKRIPTVQDISWWVEDGLETGNGTACTAVVFKVSGRWCFYVDRWFLTEATRDDITTTVLHELAHLVTPFRSNPHGARWESTFYKLLRGFNMDAKFFAKYDNLSDPFYL